MGGLEETGQPVLNLETARCPARYAAAASVRRLHRRAVRPAAVTPEGVVLVSTAVHSRSVLPTLRLCRRFWPVGGAYQGRSGRQAARPASIASRPPAIRCARLHGTAGLDAEMSNLHGR